ncbi:MAG TPA: type 4a pilus biogenesis protein PilO [Mycobacteriales bacterium]|nr:type 4a pilus biogenesis protein PilO [Mycobacteriales bacterium]
MTPTRRWLVIGVVTALVVLLAGWVLVVKPQKSKVSDLNAQTATQVSANNLLLTQISALQSEQKELPQQQLALQKFSTEIPDSTAEPTLVRQLTAAAQHADVELVSIAPGSVAPVSATAAATTSSTLGSAAPAAAGSLDELPVALSVIGSYANVESFFNAIEHLPRAMLVTSFSVCPEVSSGVGTPCQGPAEPANKVAPPGSVGVALSGDVFFTPTTTPTSTSTTETLATPPSTPATTAAGAPDVTGPSTTGAAAGTTS